MLLLWSAQCLRIMCTRASSPNLSLRQENAVKHLLSVSMFCMDTLFAGSDPLYCMSWRLCEYNMNTTANISKQSVPCGYMCFVICMYLHWTMVKNEYIYILCNNGQWSIMALAYVIYTFLPVYPLNHDGAMKNIVLDAALDSNYKILQTDRRSHAQGDTNLFLFHVLCDEQSKWSALTIVFHTYILRNTCERCEIMRK